MINLLLGRPGSGKTYESVVNHVLPALREGRKVITNLPLNLAELDEAGYFPYELVTIIEPTAKVPRPFSVIEHFQDDWRHPLEGYGALFVIDECHECHPRGTTPVAIKEWYAKSRHAGADVLLITQSYGKVDKDIIELVQTVFRVSKLVALGMMDRYVIRAYDGVRNSFQLSENYRSYDPDLYKFYKSHTLSNNAVKEQMVKDIRPIWKHPLVYATVFFFIVALAIIPFLRNPFNNAALKKPDLTNIAVPSSNVSLPNNNIPNTTKEIQNASSPQAQPQSNANVSNIKSNNSSNAFKDTSHPFSNFGLHIRGHATMKGRDIHVFGFSQNSQTINELFTDDLKKAGYEVTLINHCLAELSYKSNPKFYVYCDIPKTSGSGSMSAPVSSREETPKPAVVLESDGKFSNAPNLTAPDGIARPLNNGLQQSNGGAPAPRGGPIAESSSQVQSSGDVSSGHCFGSLCAPKMK